MNKGPAADAALIAGDKDLMKQYENMTAAEDEQLDATLPPGAREREEAAIEKAQAVLDATRALIATGMIQAVGYRVVIKPVDVSLELEQAEAEVAPTLAEAGFEVKSEAQRQREEHGENHGVVIHIGPTAFDRLGGQAHWFSEGDTVIFSRYAGTAVEHPPGSGNKYQIMNDEDIFGKIV